MPGRSMPDTIITPRSRAIVPGMRSLSDGFFKRNQGLTPVLQFAQVQLACKRWAMVL